MGQIVLGRKSKEKEKVPTFYLTQLIGLALGFNSKQIGLDVHRVKPRKILEAIEIA
jgi:heterodisulfide reductase subunit B